MTKYQEKLRGMRHTDLIGELGHHEEIRIRCEVMLDASPFEAIGRTIRREMDKSYADSVAVQNELLRRLEGGK